MHSIPYPITLHGQAGYFIPSTTAPHADMVGLGGNGVTQYSEAGPRKRSRGDGSEYTVEALSTLREVNAALSEQISHLGDLVKSLRIEISAAQTTIDRLSSQLRREKSGTQAPDIYAELRNAVSTSSPFFTVAWKNAGHHIIAALRSNELLRHHPAIAKTYLPCQTCERILEITTTDMASVLARVTRHAANPVLANIIDTDVPLLLPVFEYLTSAGHNVDPPLPFQVLFTPAITQTYLSALASTRPNMIPTPLFSIPFPHTTLSPDDILRASGRFMDLLGIEGDGGHMRWIKGLSRRFGVSGMILGTLKIGEVFVAFGLHLGVKRIYVYSPLFQHGEIENLFHGVLSMGLDTDDAESSYEIIVRSLAKTNASHQSNILALRILESLSTPRLQCDPVATPPSELVQGAKSASLCLPYPNQDEGSNVEFWDLLSWSMAMGLVEMMEGYEAIFKAIKDSEEGW